MTVGDCDRRAAGHARGNGKPPEPRRTRPACANCSRPSGCRRPYANRYPHELSGGQRQRVGLARASRLGPELLIADEPTSALDVSVQDAVLTLFAGPAERLGFACLFISHDLAVVHSVSQRVTVMQHGNVIESGLSSKVLQHPEASYTRHLLASVPSPNPIVQRQRREARTALLLSSIQGS